MKVKSKVYWPDHLDTITELDKREDTFRKEKDDGTAWYFAIGSMCNPTSLAGRNLVPKESKPA